MNAELLEQIERAASGVDFGRASAQKRGRSARLPYVPVVLYKFRDATRQEQIRGFAFATRDEAVAFADRVIAKRRAGLRERLADPRHRAEREMLGLPRELP